MVGDRSPGIESDRVQGIMAVVPPSAHPVGGIVEATGHRSALIAEALSNVSTQALSEPSLLPGWTRLTIACHLRYGADALLRMTRACLSGKQAAYYPDGRASQRPQTLEPTPGEDPREVVESLRRLSSELAQLWSGLDTAAWDREITEPDENPDLGTIPLSGLALLRLTEVEVHGSDLDLGLDNWSELFVRAVLPTRLKRLSVRRTNHRTFDPSLQGTWLLLAIDGPTFIVTVDGEAVGGHPADPNAKATAVIEATSRDLLALLLGRPLIEAPRIRGDATFGAAFQAAFPGP
jgi:maleylpyruvate isomerase